MTREIRESELVRLMQANFPALVELYKRAAGIPPGTMPQVGMLASQLIKVILDKEFPPGSA